MAQSFTTTTTTTGSGNPRNLGVTGPAGSVRVPDG
jgi:hypothetical protein